MIYRVAIILLIILIVFLQYKLWVGENSLAHVNELRNKISVQEKELNRLANRNQELRFEIEGLKLGSDVVEERARKELGMIKEGETFYQIIEDE